MTISLDSLLSKGFFHIIPFCSISFLLDPLSASCSYVILPANRRASSSTFRFSWPPFCYAFRTSSIAQTTHINLPIYISVGQFAPKSVLLLSIVFYVCFFACPLVLYLEFFLPALVPVQFFWRFPWLCSMFLSRTSLLVEHIYYSIFYLKSSDDTYF